MTLDGVLDLHDHEVWVRVRVHDGSRAEPDHSDDIVFWSADWLGGGEDDPGIPDELSGVLDWDADELSIETHSPGKRRKPAPMLVINAYRPTREDQ